MTPLVSVVVPVYNTERFVREAIESVLGQLGVAPVEIVCVDDGSTDGSMAAVAGFGAAVKVMSHSHAGIGATRNLGVAAAGGEYLAFLDADDLWTPAKLARQLAELQAPGAPPLVAGMVEQFRHLPSGEREVVGRIAPGYVAGAMLMRRETFECVGPFATDVRAGEFIDWYARASDLGLRTLVLDDVVLHRRIHDANTARTSGDANQDVVSVLRAALQRRRSVSGEQ
ncbi:MAG: glycosyltransferase family 2 protein [Tepidiformaceae bacterium]